MSIEHQIQYESTIMKVKAVGTCDHLGQLKEYVLAMHKTAQSAGMARALVNERELRYHLSTTDSFESGKLVAEMARRGHKIAVVCNSEGKADVKFWETVVVNRGTLVKLFNDTESAEEWIRQEKCSYNRLNELQESLENDAGKPGFQKDMKDE